MSVTRRNRGVSALLAAWVCASAALLSSAPVGAVEVIERSFSASDGGQADHQGGVGASPQATPATAPTGEPASLDARVSRLEHMLEGGALVDMLSRLDNMQQQMQKMQGDLEVQQHDLETLRQHQRDLYLDLDRRLHQLEVNQSAASSNAGPGPAPATAPGAAPAAPGVASVSPAPAGAVSAPDMHQVQAAYDQAFNLLRAAQYDKAIAAFQQFLQQYPQGPLSDNAQYWLGEANYVTRRFPEALKEFQKVVSQYPNSPKVPDAQLKVGFTHYELDQWDDARKALTEVMNKYPDSTAAKLAQNRLQRMKKEGH